MRQNFILILLTTSSLVAAIPKPEPKPTPKAAYYSQLTGYTDNGDAKIYENRGFIPITRSNSGDGFLDYVSSTGAPHSTISVIPPSTSDILAADYLRDQSAVPKLPPTFFTAWQTTTSRGGKVYIHRGFKRTSQKQWSNVQILSPPAQYKEQSFFGKSISADQRTHRKLAVGCPGCNATTTSGQVYLYSPNSAGTAWSQTQVLNITAYGYNHLGDTVHLHDNVLLASIRNPSLLRKDYLIYKRNPNETSDFEFQQRLSMKNGNITSAAIYEETIVLGNSAAYFGGLANVGEVQILYPSSPAFRLKPAVGSSRPMQWSVQQILRASDLAASDTFGAGVAIDQNIITVAATGANAAYIFKREEKSGKWSQQQILATTAPVTTSVAGSKFTVSSTTSDITVFSNQGVWKCLVISLEDHFGDGWDTAELNVSAPDGTYDYFSLGCDNANPLQLRYCPNDRSDGGLYTFSIPNAIKAKHYWELQWGIFEENSGLWHRGKWDTQMDFHWDPSSLTFTPRKLYAKRKNVTTCESCPFRPTEKPTYSVFGRRILKGATLHPTLHPTVSPAPTLKVTNVNNWRYLTLIGDSHSWFDNQYRGTEYYITDAYGRNLIQSGTACVAGITQQCWVDLPDGDYILRVGGALDANQGDHTFTFCKLVTAKTAGNQMTFRIKNGDCTVVTTASRDAVCKSNGYAILTTFYLVLNVNIIIHDVILSSVSNADRNIFNAAVASLFHGMQATDVDLVSAIPSGSSTFVSVNLHISSNLGYNLLDIDQEAAFETFLKNIFTNEVNELSLAVALSSGSGASSFTPVTMIEFIDYQIVDSHETLPIEINEEEVDQITSYIDPSTSVTTESTQNYLTTLISMGSYSGYLLGAVGVLFLVAFSIFKPQSSSNKSENINSSDAKESNTSPQIETGRRQLTQTPLTIGDLKELAHMEQEYLNIVNKVDFPQLSP